VSALAKINNDFFSLSYVLFSTFIFSAVTYYVIEKPGIALFRYRLKYKVVDNIKLAFRKKEIISSNPETLHVQEGTTIVTEEFSKPDER
jgi:peptidoglycan/LPS O-acetylase OafA/YrhL